MLSDFVSGVVEPALGVSFPDYILIVALIILFIFFAIDVRVGLLLTFVSVAALYIGFSAIGWPTANILTILLAVMVLMALSLFISHQKRGAYQ